MIEDSREFMQGDSAPPPTASAMLISRFYDLFTETRPLGVPDFAYFDGLVADFGDALDLMEEMKRFHAWSLDRASSGVVIQHPRSRFRNWLRLAVGYDSNR